MNRRLMLLAACVLTPAASVLGQFKPTVDPAKQPDGPENNSPLPQAPGSAPNEYPGPRGTKITFPTTLYDENASGTEQIQKAREEAKKEGKRVLVMWGENRCGFCVFLNDILVNDETVGPLVKTEYIWIKVNIGKFDRNVDLADRYSTPITDPKFGAPALAVIDPDSDRATDVKGGNALVAKPMTPDHVFDEKVIREFLINNRAPARVAQTGFNNAVAVAAGSKRAVLAYFVVPLSEECQAMESWITDPAVAPVLERGYQPVKIDLVRMIGGRTVLNSLSEGKVVAPPCMAIVDAKGDLMVPGARFGGLPTSTEDIARFIEFVKKTAPAIDDAGRAALAKSLKAAGEAKMAAKADEKK